MPTESNKPRRLDDSRRSHTTQVRSPASIKQPVRETRTKSSQTPDPKPAPAVKGLTKNQSKNRPVIKKSFRSQPGPVPSPAARIHSATAATRSAPLATVRAANSTHDINHLRTLKSFSKVPISKAKNHDQAPHNGRQDPYHIPSDSEDENLRGCKPISVVDERKSTLSQNMRTNNLTPPTRQEKALSSALSESAAKPPSTLVPSQKTHVLGGRRSGSRTPAPIPRGAQIISVASSSNEHSGHRTSKHKSNIKRSIPAHIVDASMVIAVDDSSSNEVDLSPTKVLRPHSTIASSSASSLHTPSRATKSTHVISSTRSLPQSCRRDSDQMLTSVNPTAKAMGKRSSHSVNSHLKIIDEKPRHMEQVLDKSSPVNAHSRASIGSQVNRGSTQTKSKRSREPDRRILDSGIPSSRRAAIDEVKKTMKVKFKKAKDKPIPESFFKEPEYSDDEYQPLGDEELSSESRDTGLLSFQESTTISTPPPADDRKPSRPSPHRMLRSGSRLKLPVSFNPINKLAPQVREEGSYPKLPVRPSKFGRGYSKRVRDAFSDTSSSRGPEDDTDEQVESNAELQLSQDSRSGDEESAVAQPTDYANKPRWSPHSWMERYETEFMPGRDGSVWLATGPFKGWILDGPRAGGYIPGCKEPDDETIAEAEKTAELRWNQRWADSESDYISDVEGSGDEAVNIGQTTPDIYEDTASTNIRQPPVEDSEERSTHRLSLLSTSRNVPGNAKPEIDLHDRAVERAERTERTKQYVLSSGSGNEVDSQPKTIPPRSISSRTRGKLPAYLAPTTAPQNTPSPPSAESETTSTLITQQLINDCAPPSNQELAELMSSSPAIRRTNTPSSVHNVDESAGSSSSESSSGIPAHISPKPPARGSEVPQTQDPFFRPEHVNAAHIFGGIAGRRTTRSLTNLLPHTLKSNRLAQNVEQGSTDAEPEPSSQSKKHSPKTKIVVEVPGLSMEEQREYDVVSLTPDIRSTLSPKSFKEINEATSRADADSNDPDAEQTLDYVLRQSPRWLTSITEANETNNTNVPRPLGESITAPLTQKSLEDTAKPVVPSSDSEAPENLYMEASNTAAPTTRKKGKDKIGESSEAKERRKRKASITDSSLAGESSLSKKQKTDGQSRAKTERLTYRQRKRLQKRSKEKQQKDDQAQRHVDNAIGKGVNGSSQSTMTPPASSRPVSSEAK